MPGVPEPALVEAYETERRRLGLEVGQVVWPGAPICVHVADDPDRAWVQLAPHALHETNAYAMWSSELPGSNPWVPVDDADGLRAHGLYAVVTPDQCVDLYRSLDPRANLILRPTIAGKATGVDDAYQRVARQIPVSRLKTADDSRWDDRKLDMRAPYLVRAGRERTSSTGSV